MNLGLTQSVRPHAQMAPFRPRELALGYAALWHARYFSRSSEPGQGFERWLQERLMRYSRPYGVAPVLPVPRVHFSDLTPRLFQKIYSNRPVVIQGALAGSAAVDGWSFDSFRKRFADTVVPVASQAVEGKPVEDMKVSELIESVRQSTGKPRYLMASSSLFEAHPELLRELDVLRLQKLFGKTVIRAEMFLGTEKNGSPYHCASSGNVFCNVHGRKDWLLVAPQHSMWMYPQIGRNGLAVYVNSPVLSDREEEVDAKYPLYRYVPKLAAQLVPGDILYVPPWWWHEVTNRSETIGVPVRLLDSGGGNLAFSLLQVSMLGVSPRSAAALLPVVRQLARRSMRQKSLDSLYLSDDLTRLSHASSRLYDRGWSRYPESKGQGSESREVEVFDAAQAV